MSRDVASIFAAAEDAPAPLAAFATCHVCGQRRPTGETYRPPLTKFRAETVDPATGRYPEHDSGYRPGITRCKDALRCREALEAFGETWPLDDGLWRLNRNEPSPDKPAVAVAPDPPEITPVPEQATPTTAPYADLDDDDGWF